MLGLVTIGQAPRDDVTASMFGGLPAGVVKRERWMGSMTHRSPRSRRPLASTSWSRA